jgi:hypothetical protein
LFINSLINGSIYDHRFKGFYHVSFLDLKEAISRSNGSIISRIIKESALGTSETIIFPQNHRLFEDFDRKIQEMVTAGLVDYLRNDYKDLMSKKRFAVQNVETAMSLEHLEAAFALWLVSLIFPVTAFICEWIFKCIETIKDFIVFKCVFVAYIKQLESETRTRDQKMQRILSEIEAKKAKFQQIDETRQIHQTIQVQLATELKNEEDQTNQTLRSQNFVDYDLIDELFGELIEELETN